VDGIQQVKLRDPLFKRAIPERLRDEQLIIKWHTNIKASSLLIIYLLKFEASVRLCAPSSQKTLTLYPATDCAAETDISGVSGRWQLSR